MFIKIAPEFLVNSDNNGYSSSPSITSLADGGFVVIWDSINPNSSESDVYGQRYDANGIKVGQTFRVNTGTENSQFGDSAIALTNGGFIVTWTSSGQNVIEADVYGQLYKADGTQAGQQFMINTFSTNSQHDSSVASLANGGFIVTWTSFAQNVLFPINAGIYGQRYNADGSKAGQEFQVNTSTPNILINSSVISLTDSGFVVVWESRGRFTSSAVYGQRYDANGNPIDREFIIDSDNGINSGAVPSIATLSDGGFIVVWVFDDGSMGGISGQRYDANGNPIGQELRINTATDGPQRNPSVASLTDGGFIVTWDNQGLDGTSDDIYGQQYDTNGNPIGQEFRINTISNDFNLFYPAVTSLVSGGYAVAWVQSGLGSGDDIYGAIFGTGEAGTISFEQTSYSIREDGTPITTMTLVRTGGSDGDVSVTLTPSNGTAIANDYNNNPIIVAFAPGETSKTITVPIVVNDGQIEADETLNLTLSNPTGTATLGSNINATLTIVDNDNNNLPKTPAIRVGSEFLIKSSNTAISVIDPDVISLNDGGFVVAWERVNNYPSIGIGPGFAGQRYDASGNSIGLEFTISDVGRGIAITSLADGGFVAAWVISSTGIIGEPDNIYGQRYDNNGDRVGQEFQVFDNPPSFSNISYPSITSLADGGVIIIWEDVFKEILGRRFDANGNPVGLEFQINTFTPSTEGDSSITSLNDGGFVVTWTSFAQDGSDGGIYGQRFDANSNRFGSEFQVNTITIGNQENSVVKSLNNGEFVVIWESEGQDGSFNGIYGQRYDVNGNPIGSEFRVNTRTLGTQELPSVSSLTNGGFVVTWQSFFQENFPGGFTQYYDGLYGQQYDAEGNPVGQEFRVNTDNFPTNPAITSLNDGGFVVVMMDDFFDIYGQIFQPVNGLGIFEFDKLARSGFVGQLSFDPIDVGNLPLTSLYDETYYLNQNPDVTSAVTSGVLSNGYHHFVAFGQFEGRNPSTLYNETLYLAQNSDVADAVTAGTFSSGFQHYISVGQQESRSPSDLFDEQAYRINNPDVNDFITSGGLRSGFEHFLKLGKDEGRLPSNFLYDESYYLLQNPDVAAAVAADVFEDGFTHYISFGQGEKRNPSSLFNENQYLALNPDVADAVNSNLLASGFKHYILSGRAENRPL